MDRVSARAKGRNLGYKLLTELLDDSLTLTDKDNILSAARGVINAEHKSVMDKLHIEAIGDGECPAPFCKHHKD